MTSPAPRTPPLRIRSTPEDFRVVEAPLYPASGEGGHTFLFVEKRGRTTEQVARDLARLSGVPARDVGYAGRKDRHAVTRQWFSLEGVDPDAALRFELEGAEVLEALRHGNKLRTGHLRENAFEIVLRGDEGIELAPIEARVEETRRRGLPNRFGDQRFGRDGDNAERAREMLAGGRAPRDKRKARFLVSALQSEIFNAVLEARGDGFDSVMLGDVARVEESGGLFWVDDPATDALRARAFEISATGPIIGTKMREPRDAAAALEAEVFERFGFASGRDLKPPRGVRAQGTRRPLRVRPEGLAVEALEDGRALRLTCRLPPGAYVTVLIETLVGPFVDVSRSPSFPDVDADRAVS